MQQIPVGSADIMQLAAQAHSAGDLRGSMRILHEAIDADGGDADKYYALGRCQRALNDHSGAETSYRRALALRPAFTEAWISLGVLLKQLGRFPEAESAQRGALAIEPENFLARLNLGNALLAQGRDVEAEAAFRTALEVNPDCAEAHNNLARLLLARTEYGEAIGHFAAALRVNSNYFEAAVGLGAALLKTDEYEAAIEPLRVAHNLRPTDFTAMQLLGRACSGVGEYQRAAALFEAMLRERPTDRDTRFDLALVQLYAGQYTRPRATLEALLAEESDDFASMAYASLLLRNGEFSEGWKHYESRWSLDTPDLRKFREPRWRGESLAGKTLLIAREQGLGDEIMFASIFPEVLPLADHCIIECEERLMPLYRRSFPGTTLFAVERSDTEWHSRLDTARADLPRFDYWVSLGDLARLKRNRSADFPCHGGYLTADAAQVRAFRDRLEARSGSALKVGIGWRGGTARTRSSQRSLTLEQLRPLLGAAGVHFVSLQYGPCQQEIETFRASSGIAIDHWQEAIDDIDACAALVSSLDLVISVCSAVIHLSGALGRPAWVMAPMVPEWRYGRDGDSMIWYPSVRMFRQKQAREWGRVVGDVRRALTKLPRAAQQRGAA